MFLLYSYSTDELQLCSPALWLVSDFLIAVLLPQRLPLCSSLCLVSPCSLVAFFTFSLSLLVFSVASFGFFSCLLWLLPVLPLLFLFFHVLRSIRFLSVSPDCPDSPESPSSPVCHSLISPLWITAPIFLLAFVISVLLSVVLPNVSPSVIISVFFCSILLLVFLFGSMDLGYYLSTKVCLLL